MKKKKSFWSRLGPGFITGAADDDPSGIVTYSQTGAQFGYGQLWVSLFSFPLMMVVQEMCGRIGAVTGKGLSGVMKAKYPKIVFFFIIGLLFLANTLNVGADLGAMASVTQLIFGLPFFAWLIFVTILSLVLQIIVPYPTYAKFLKYLTLSLLAYMITTFLVHQDWGLILRSTFLPIFVFDRAWILNIVAILGTTISPYLFFWQADEEVEEEISHNKLLGFGIGHPKISKEDLNDLWKDTAMGMFFSNLMMFFIIVTTASTIGAHGPVVIADATQAALALRPLAGDGAYILFAFGIIGTGLLAVPILAGAASYAVSEALGWKSGLSSTWRQAPLFYAVIGFSMLIGFCLNLFHFSPFQMLYYTAVFNGLVAPFLLIFILHISNNKKIMGKHTNKWYSNVLGIAATILMFSAGGLLIFLS